MRKLFCSLKNMDASIMNLMKVGIKFSFIICLLFTYILYLYIFNPFSHIAFDIGYLGVKCSFMFFSCFFGIAIVANKIKIKEI